jgi:WD40 repeat protein
VKQSANRNSACRRSSVALLAAVVASGGGLTGCAPGPVTPSTVYDKAERWACDTAIARRAPVVAVAASDGSVWILDARNGQVRASWTPPVTPESPSAPVAPAASDELEVWDESTVWTITLDDEGERAAWLTASGELHEWRWGEEKAPALLDATAVVAKKHGFSFGAFLEYSASGERLLVGAEGGPALLLDRDGRRVAQIDGLAATMFAVPLCWDASGDRFVAITNDGLRVFDAESGHATELALTPKPSAVTAVVFSPSGKEIAVGSADCHLAVYDVTSGRRRSNHALKAPMFILGAVVGAIAFSPNGEWIAATTTPSVAAFVVENRSGAEVQLCAQCGGRMGEVAPISWSSKSRLFHFAYASGVMPVRRVRVGEPPVVDELERGSLPEFGWHDLAVQLADEEVRGFQGGSRRPSWTIRL